MLELLLSLIGTDLGKYLALALAGAAALFGFRLKSKADGRAEERQRQAQASLEAHKTRDKIDDAVSKTPDAARRDELAGWVPDDRKL